MRLIFSRSPTMDSLNPPVRRVAHGIGCLVRRMERRARRRASAQLESQRDGAARRGGPVRLRPHRTGRLVEGIVAGRFSPALASSDEPADVRSFDRHFSGWRAESIDRDLVPRVYDLLLDGQYRARLRIDRSVADPADPANVDRYEGRLK